MPLCQLHVLVTCFHLWIRAAVVQTAADDCPVPVQVLVKDSASTHRLRFGASGPDQDSTCEVSWISHELFSLVREAGTEGVRTEALDSEILSQDFVLTDALKRVPFAGRRGRLAFLERILPMPRLDNEQLDSILAGKELLISVMLPRKNSKAWSDMQTCTIAQQAAAVLPDHTFLDDGMAVTYEQAFVPYRFSLIVDDDNETVSQAFVHCIGWGTIPLFNGFSHMVAMLPRIVVPWDPISFRMEALLSFLPGINYDIASLWQQHRLVQDLSRIEHVTGAPAPPCSLYSRPCFALALACSLSLSLTLTCASSPIQRSQDQLLYRYSRGFNDSLKAAACHLCAYQQTSREDSPLPLCVASCCFMLS